MKPRILILLLCICAATVTKAQFVSIPDTNFVAWLNSNGYSQCMNGNQLDTTCNAVVTNANMNCSNRNIYSLEGVQYFDNLKTLRCKINYLTSLPPLPTTLTLLDCEENNITALPALPLGLAYLYCDKNDLTTLPTLPASLVYIRCRENNISSLPTLPNSLQSLLCSQNNISALPTLPSSLNGLMCQGNQISALPALPAGLVTLYANGNQLTSLPVLPDTLQVLNVENNSIAQFDSFPRHLEELYISVNPIDTLPELPLSLLKLFCISCNFTHLPPLPAALKTLLCGRNALTELPALPATLGELYCDQCGLNSLPAIPAAMWYLYCPFNNLKSIPNLSANPYIQLVCNNNILTGLPEMADTIAELNVNYNPGVHCLPKLRHAHSLSFTGTSIMCAPSYFSYYTSTPALQSLPLCDTLNMYNCPTNWNVAGVAYKDEDNDCNILAGTDSLLHNIKMKLYQNGVLKQEHFGGAGGYYSFEVEPSSNYVLTTDESQIPFVITCPDSGSISIITDSANLYSNNNNFGFECKTGFDLTARSISSRDRFRPANYSTVNFFAGDLANFYNATCANGVAGTVTVIIDEELSYISALPNTLVPNAVNGDTLTWNIADFGAIDANTAFSIVVQTDTDAIGGSIVCFTAKVSATTADNDSSNNSTSYCYFVVNSYDPNDKQVYPSALIDTSQEWLTYTVRFQNTGTAEAQHIYVMDTLDGAIDASSFELLAYSHQPNVQINEHIVRFNFPFINLPDSNSNEAASHGFIQYKVKLKEGLPIGTEIDNTAFIYFDFNAPVVTNTVTNTIGVIEDTTGVGISEAYGELAISIYPNPANDMLWISTDEPNCKVYIYNLQGELLYNEAMPKQKYNIDIAHLPSGVYAIEVTGTSKGARRKLVKL